MSTPVSRNVNFRKRGGAALSIVLAMSLTPMAPSTAWAEEPNAAQGSSVVEARDAAQTPSETSVASVVSGDSTLYYDSLKEAVEAAAAGSTVALLQNVTINEAITVANNITLRLDGHTATNNVSAERAFIVTGSGFTIDGTAAGSQMVIPETNTGSYGFVKVAAVATVTLNGGTYSGNTDNGAFVIIMNRDPDENEATDNSIDASGSSVIFDNVTMSSNGRFFNTDTLTTSADITTLEVNGGTFTTSGMAFGVDTIERSRVTFTDVQVTAGTGPCIEATGSDATFTDCTFTVTGENSNGFGTTAVAVSWDGLATINGGTYSAPNGYGAYVYSSGGQIIINDGYVSGEIALRADVDLSSYPSATANITVYGGTTDGEWQTSETDAATLTAAGGTHTRKHFKAYLVDDAAVRQNGTDDATTYTVYGSKEDALAAEGGGYCVDIDGHIWVFDTQEEAEAAGGVGSDIVLNHVVTFSNQGEEWSNIAPDGSPVEEPTAPSRAGYIFLGWYTADGRLYDFATPVTADITLTARWAAIPVVEPDPSYEVTIEQSENGTVSVSPESAKEGDAVTITLTPDFGYELAQVTVADEDGDAIELTANADGTYSFTMPAGDVSVHASFADTWENPFSDVDAGDWFYEEVRLANLMGLMHGYPDGTFGPLGPITREEAATVMWNLLADGATGSPAAGHDDVDQDGWCADYVNWAVENGIMQGYSADDFGIGDALTREQFAAMIANTAGADLESVDLSVLEQFPDADEVSDWARPVVAWAVENGVLNGVEMDDSSRELQPTRDLNRAEMAAMMVNAVQESVL